MKVNLNPSVMAVWQAVDQAPHFSLCILRDKTWTTEKGNNNNKDKDMDNKVDGFPPLYRRVLILPLKSCLRM